MSASNLTGVQRALILDYFRDAVRARQEQWEAERRIERILKREIDDFKIADFAVGNASALVWADIKEVLA